MTAFARCAISLSAFFLLLFIQWQIINGKKSESLILQSPSRFWVGDFALLKASLGQLFRSVLCALLGKSLSHVVLSQGGVSLLSFGSSTLCSRRDNFWRPWLHSCKPFLCGRAIVVRTKVIQECLWHCAYGFTIVWQTLLKGTVLVFFPLCAKTHFAMSVTLGLCCACNPRVPLTHGYVRYLHAIHGWRTLLQVRLG